MGLYDEFKNNRLTAHSIPARIMVIGVGGAGGNTVDHIFQLGIKGVNLMICNTDSKALDKSPLEPSQKICMGDGKGAGNDATVGQNKARESLAEIREYVESRNPDLVFITAGMGGGTGTGATPVIAQMIHSFNIPTIAILTTPPVNEGVHRFEQAMEGIRSMRELVDTFIIIKNETIIELSEERSVHDAFNMANDIVAYAAKGIAEIALQQSDLVSVDISDVCKVIRDSRYAVMGMAAEAGEDRVVKAIRAAVLSPLFGNVPIKGAKEVLVNFATSSSSELKMKEVNKALNYIQQVASGQDANGDIIPVNIIWGTSVKPELGDKIEIIIVVTGFHANAYYSQTFNGKLDLALPSDEPEQIVDPQEEIAQPEQQVVVEVQPEEQPEPQPVVEKVEVVTLQPTVEKPEIEEPKVVVSKVEVPKVVEVKPEEVKVETPKVVVPKVEKPKVVVTPVVPQPVQPVQPVQPQQPADDTFGNEPWRVPIPERKEIRPIPPQLLLTNYKLDSKTPAYKSRRGMVLINEVKGKKIVIKMDGSKSAIEEVVGDSMQQSLDF